MSLGDFLKKTVDSAKKMIQGNGEEAAAARLASEKEEKARKREEHMAAYETEREARRGKLAQYASLAPTCEKGDCAMFNGYFYYSCPDGCECRRKRLVEDLRQHALPRPEYMPYIKWMEDLDKYMEGRTDIDGSTFAGGVHLPLMDERQSPEKEIINCYDEVAVTFVENELPDYIASLSDLLKLEFNYSLRFDGFREKNVFLQFLTRAHERKFDITKCPTKHLRELVEDTEWLKLEKLDIHIHIDKDFYYNPSLYRRTVAEFEYAVKIFEIFTTREYFEVMLPALPYDPEKYMAMMLDENGNFKPTGLGGPEKGEWGDTIWNAVTEITADEAE